MNNMRLLLYTTLLTLIIVSPTPAQDLGEAAASMSLGTHNGFTLGMPEYDARFADGIWRTHLGTYKGKSRKVKKSAETFTDDALAPAISAQPIDIYSYVEKQGNGSVLRLWVDLGGSFLSSADHPDAYSGLQLMIAGYQKMLNVEAIKNDLKAEETKLKDFEKELSRLERLNDRYKKEIEDWLKKIAENEDKIKSNDAEQSTARGAIDQQKEQIRQVEVKLARAEI